VSNICDDDDWGWAEGNKLQQHSEELLKKAEAGDRKAQVQLADCYKWGPAIS